MVHSGKKRDGSNGEIMVRPGERFTWAEQGWQQNF